LTLRQFDAAMDAAFRLDLDERRARALDLRAAMADGKDFQRHMERLKPKR